MRRDSPVKRLVTPHATTIACAVSTLIGMDKPIYKKTYIREWRKERGLSLRRLAARMETEPGVELVSHAQIARIETGEQPYSQTIIEAIADALDVTVPMLLEMNPKAEGEVVDLLRHLDAAKRKQALAILRALMAS